MDEEKHPDEPKTQPSGAREPPRRPPPVAVSAPAEDPDDDRKKREMPKPSAKSTVRLTLPPKPGGGFPTQNISPFKGVLLAMVFSALVFVIVIPVVLPEFRNVSGVLRAMLFGAALGLFVWTPLVFAGALANRYRPWIKRYGRAIDRWTSGIMLISLGYCIACGYHGVSDQWVVVAVFLVGLCAFVRVGLIEAVQTPSNPPPPPQNSKTVDAAK